MHSFACMSGLHLLPCGRACRNEISLRINPPCLSPKQALTPTDLNRRTISLTVRSLHLNGFAMAMLLPDAPIISLQDARGTRWPCTLPGLKAEEKQAFYRAAATGTMPVIAANRCVQLDGLADFHLAEGAGVGDLVCIGKGWPGGEEGGLQLSVRLLPAAEVAASPVSMEFVRQAMQAAEATGMQAMRA